MGVTEREILIWLNHLGGTDYHMVKRLERYFGNLCELWEADGVHFEKAIKNHRIIVDRMKKNRNRTYLEEIIKGLLQYGIDAITLADEEYPHKLRGIYDPPTVIYIKGARDFNRPLIAMVGSRKATSYGKWAAYHLSKELSQRGVGIISGLALGIDSASHRGAVENNGYTLGVLACGLDQCYPASNRGLGEQIIENGCLISEYSPKIAPLKHHFPARNRIISGLSDGVAVIEAAEKSGALITVDFALQQGKEVYALPGNINQPQSKGTNLLIRDGAKLLLGAEEIIEELERVYGPIEKQVEAVENQLGSKEAVIYGLIKQGPIHIDMLTYLSKIKMQELNGILTALELKGFISQLPGKTFTVN